MPPKKRCRDLNQQVNNEERKRQKVHQRGNRKVSILFNGRGIQNAIVKHIKHEDTAYVVGCVAWLSNKRILKAMAENLKGVTLITTTDKLQSCRAALRVELFVQLEKARGVTRA
jgi:hypothetical protein